VSDDQSAEEKDAPSETSAWTQPSGEPPQRWPEGLAEQHAARVFDYMDTWTCLGPGCSKSTPRRFWCSDDCRTKALEAERKKRAGGGRSRSEP